MKFDKVLQIIGGLRKPLDFDFWDEDLDMAKREAYNKALEDVAETLKLELEKEKIRHENNARQRDADRDDT